MGYLDQIYGPPQDQSTYPTYGPPAPKFAARSVPPGAPQPPGTVPGLMNGANQPMEIPTSIRVTPASPAMPSVPFGQAPAPTPTMDPATRTPMSDKLLQQQQQLVAAGPQVRKMGMAEKILGVVGSGMQGWGNAGQGMRSAEEYFGRPKVEAEREWERRVGAGQQEIGSAERSEEMVRQDRREASVEQNQAEERKFRDWQMSGGPEKNKIAMEQGQRDKGADTLRKSGAYTDKEIAEYQATGNLLRRDPLNEAELALRAAKGDQDALGAIRIQRQTRIAEISAARDPQEKTRLLVDMRNGDIQIRGQLENALTRIEANPMARTDPTMKAQADAIRKQMTGLDADIQYTQSQMQAKMGGQDPAAVQRPSQPDNRPANVPPDYVFMESGPKGKGWYPPQ